MCDRQQRSLNMHSQILRGGSAAAVACRRMRHIVGAVLGRDGWMWRTHEVKLINTASGNGPGRNRVITLLTHRGTLTLAVSLKRLMSVIVYDHVERHQELCWACGVSMS